jgi:hypothetical protein
MIVDDMKMKWVAIGLVGILVMTWAAAEFSSVITQSGTDTTYVIEE